jgi:hypothetical protein
MIEVGKCPPDRKYLISSLGDMEGLVQNGIISYNPPSANGYKSTTSSIFGTDNCPPSSPPEPPTGPFTVTISCNEDGVFSESSPATIPGDAGGFHITTRAYGCGPGSYSNTYVNWNYNTDGLFLQSKLQEMLTSAEYAAASYPDKIYSFVSMATGIRHNRFLNAEWAGGTEEDPIAWWLFYYFPLPPTPNETPASESFVPSISLIPSNCINNFTKCGFSTVKYFGISTLLNSAAVPTLYKQYIVSMFYGYFKEPNSGALASWTECNVGQRISPEVNWNQNVPSNIYIPNPAYLFAGLYGNLYAKNAPLGIYKKLNDRVASFLDESFKLPDLSPEEIISILGEPNDLNTTFL